MVEKEEGVNPSLISNVEDIIGRENILFVELVEEPQNIEEEDNNLGRLKRTTKDLCPECNEKNLQIRVRKLECIEEGEEYLKDVDYFYCPGCQYEGIIEPKRKRKKMNMREEDDFSDSNNSKRKSTPGRNDEHMRRGNTNRQRKGNARPSKSHY